MPLILNRLHGGAFRVLLDSRAWFAWIVHTDDVGFTFDRRRLERGRRKGQSKLIGGRRREDGIIVKDKVRGRLRRRFGSRLKRVDDIVHVELDSCGVSAPPYLELQNRGGTLSLKNHDLGSVNPRLEE